MVSRGLGDLRCVWWSQGLSGVGSQVYVKAALTAGLDLGIISVVLVPSMGLVQRRHPVLPGWLAV